MSERVIEYISERRHDLSTQRATRLPQRPLRRLLGALGGFACSDLACKHLVCVLHHRLRLRLLGAGECRSYLIDDAGPHLDSRYQHSVRMTRALAIGVLRCEPNSVGEVTRYAHLQTLD